MSKYLPALQSQMSKNKFIIRSIEEAILKVRIEKAHYDMAGELMYEYGCHEELKFLRKELKDYVKIQKALKAMASGKESV